MFRRVESEGEFLRGQIGVTDRIIEAPLDRDPETNILIIVAGDVDAAWEKGRHAFGPSLAPAGAARCR